MNTRLIRAAVTRKKSGLLWTNLDRSDGKTLHCYAFILPTLKRSPKSQINWLLDIRLLKQLLTILKHNFCHFLKNNVGWIQCAASCGSGKLLLLLIHYIDYSKSNEGKNISILKKNKKKHWWQPFWSLPA